MGMFPKSLPGNRYLKGPIRGHFRPRRLWSLLVVAASCWATLPPAFRGVCVLLQSGAVNISIAVVFLVLGKSWIAYQIHWQICIFYCNSRTFEFSFLSGRCSSQADRTELCEQRLRLRLQNPIEIFVLESAKICIMKSGIVTGRAFCR